MTNRKLGPALVIALVGIAASLFTPAAFADSNVRIVRVSYADGDVYLDRRDGRGFERAVMNMPVASGNRIQTGHGSLAEVEFEDGDTVRLTPDTLVDLEQLSLLNSGQRYTVVQLEDGTAYFHVDEKHDNDFRVMAGRQEITLRKDSRFRLTVGQRQMELAVSKGEVAVSGAGTLVAVRKNETFTLDFEDPGRYYLARSVEAGTYDQWDHDRDSYRERYARSSYYGGSSYGGYSPYSGYGWSDLNYYGNYIYVPGNGYVWRPFFVDASWSPYLNGAWVYYPGFGYIWVSAYPWGWLPYRYGSWSYFGGYGWCWQPGRNRWHWNNWQAVTPVHHAPRGFRQPVAPSNPGGGIVPVGRGPQPIFPDRDDGDRGAPGRKRVTMEEIQSQRNPKGGAFRGGITTTRIESDPTVGKSIEGSTFASGGGVQSGDGRNAGSGSGDVTVVRGRFLDRDSGTVGKGQSRGQEEVRQETQSGSKSFSPENSDGRRSRGDSARGAGRSFDSGGRRSFEGGGGSSPQPSRTSAPPQSQSAPSYRSAGGSSGGNSGGRSTGGNSGGYGGGGRSAGSGGGGASKGTSSGPH